MYDHSGARARHIRRRRGSHHFCSLLIIGCAIARCQALCEGSQYVDHLQRTKYCHQLNIRSQEAKICVNARNTLTTFNVQSNAVRWIYYDKKPRSAKICENARNTLTTFIAHNIAFRWAKYHMKSRYVLTLEIRWPPFSHTVLPSDEHGITRSQGMCELSQCVDKLERIQQCIHEDKIARSQDLSESSQSFNKFRMK